MLFTSNAFCGCFCDLGSWNIWQREEEESADKPTDSAARNFQVAHPAFETVQNSVYMQKKKIQYIVIHGEIINSKWVEYYVPAI